LDSIVIFNPFLDYVRMMLDIIDQKEIQQPEPSEPVASRFRQIYDVLSKRDTRAVANAPNEVVTSIDSVTTDAGGGVNGPKHPADIRVKDPSPYGK
jgi:hypothetical protein